MAFDSKALDDYVDVAERIATFREKYPDGSLQPVNTEKPYEIVNVKDATFVVYVAAAYRTSDDARPGVGSAWEPLPGRTPYTRNSELMNAETSAWGRAIIAVLAADSRKGIASQQEVRNRQAEREGGGPPRNKDGSLSRSRMTDEELHAAGSMTGPEKKAHGQLQRDGEPDPDDIVHGPPVDDPWDTGTTATKAQLGVIRRLFTDCQWSAKEDMLRASRALVGRADLEGAAELTKAEASTLIDALELAAEDEDPPTRLADLVARVREEVGQS